MVWCILRDQVGPAPAPLALRDVPPEFTERSALLGHYSIEPR